MNVPAIAKKSFDQLHGNVEYAGIVNFVINQLTKFKNKIQRARFVHQLVDEYNEEVFSHPLVEQFSPCKLGCTGCCHTQVSVTEDEAELLVKCVEDGVSIDLDRLQIQMLAKDDADAFYNLPYEQRRCVFLDDNGACKVYEDRPSVCRTNAVLGEADQCDTRETIKPTRLIRTPKSDMVIYASYLHSKAGGAMAYLLGTRLFQK